MKIKDFPNDIQPFLIPKLTGGLRYRCLGCDNEHPIEKLLYTCPQCGHVLLLFDKAFERLKSISGEMWHKIFDYR